MRAKLFILTLLLVNLFQLFPTRGATPRQPDFAYPDKVISAGEKTLKSHPSDPEITRALINIAIASLEKNPSELTPILKRIGKYKDATGASPALKAMLSLLEADLYASAGRNAPNRDVDSDNDDWRQWSRGQFQARVSQLVSEATGQRDALIAVPISQWSTVITNDDADLYPTLYDFVAQKGISLLIQSANFKSSLPQSALAPVPFFITQTFATSDSVLNQVMQLYASLLTAHGADTEAYVNVDLQRLEFAHRHVNSSDEAYGNALKNLYERYQHSPLCVPVLVQWCEARGADDAMYPLMARACTDFPKARQIPWLNNTMAELAQPSITIDMPESAAPDTDLEIQVRGRNFTSAFVDIYDASASDAWESTYNLPQGSKPIISIPVQTGGGKQVPFQDSATVTVRFPKLGYYVAVPRFDKVWGGKKSFSKIHITRLALAASSFRETGVWVVDPLDGTPVQGAEVLSHRNDDNKSWGLTDLEGALRIGTDDVGYGYTMRPVKGDDRYASPKYVSFYREYSRKGTYMTGATALALYRPGDEVEFMGVVYSVSSDSASRALPGVRSTFRLLDANHQTVDTLSAVTDQWGRVAGKLRIPDNGLTGTFTINAEGHAGDIPFTVSDYKLPTFQVTTEEAEQKGAITIRGKAETYSGFPVAQAQVEMKLNVSGAFWRWRYPSEPVELYAVSGITESDGSFALTVPAEIVATSPYPRGIYRAEVTVISTSGENQRAQLAFVTQSSYEIEAAIPENVDASSSAPLKARLKNYKDETIELPINYRLLDSDKKVAASGTMPLNPSKIPSGTYQLELSAQDADSLTQSITIYRPTDKLSPNLSQLLWCAQDKAEVSRRRTQNRWLYATSCHAHLLVTLWDGDSLLQQQRVDAPAGMHTLNLSLPDNVDRANATIMAVGGYKAACRQVAVTAADAPATTLRIVSTAMRDRTVPGVPEKWTFKVQAGDAGTQAAVMLDIYNAALESLASHDLSLRFVSPTRHTYRINMPYLDGTVSQSWATPLQRLSYEPAQQPVLDTYGRGFQVYDRRNPNMNLRFCMSKGANVASPMAMADGVAEEEVAYDRAGVPEESPSRKPAEEINYRPAETPLWTFQPLLETEPDGTLTLTLTAPDENTTWRMALSAFDRCLRKGNLTADIVASKPVMVQPNLPRFLRVGDKASIPATVMNNDSSSHVVRTVVEVFNPVTSRVIATREQTDTLEPLKSALVTIEMEADEGSVMGYRVRATCGDFTDAEMANIPVEPSVTPVVESQTFCMAPDQKTLRLDIEQSKGKDGVTTLQYCNNPTWTVVTALPGILDYKPSTANGAAHSLLSACVAQGIAERNPEVVKALREWLRSDRSDSTLISTLQRNQSLKIALLQATPWMVNAANDTERMTRLALLLDKSQMETAQAAALDVLKKMQTDAGGFRWMGGCSEPSEWTTANVLLMLADLKRLDMMPDVGDMARKAVEWLDTKTVEEDRKHPNFDATLYCYLRPFFPEVPWPTAAKALYTKNVNRLAKNWKKEGVAGAAVCSQILYRADRKGIARDILESLRQRSEYTPQKGMWWPSVQNEWYWSLGKVGAVSIVLDAFHLINPQGPEVDRITQWLVLEKEAQDWGTSVTTSQVIASIMCCGRPNFGTEMAKITADGEPLELENVESCTGAFTQRLPESVRRITIEKPEGTDFPSYGAVMRQYSAEPTDIDAHCCDDLIISRRYDIVDSRVTVVLTVRTERDLDYVAIIDKRPACLEPVEQLPGYVWADGVGFYRENRDSETRIFVERMRKGTYVLTYDAWSNNDGVFAAPPASVQSQYAPRFAAHTAGAELTRE